MSTFGPPIELDGPLPAARPYGLLSVAQYPSEPDQHWAAGGVLFPYPAGPAGLHDPCSSGSDRVKTTPDPLDLVEFPAFDVYLRYSCSTFSGDLTDRLELAFRAREGEAVERQFSQGVVLADGPTPIPFLADGNGDLLNSGSATGPRDALALLENAIAATGLQGVIHADPATVTAWADLGLSSDRTRLRTVLGTPVAAGGGYIGAVRDGAGALSADQAWAFATGPVVARKGEIQSFPLSDVVDRDSNLATYQAERAWQVAWDGELQASVLVDRSV